MKPILFPANANSFTTNGLGRLDCISCVVTEERNGAYELEMSVAMTADHASEIALNFIIGAVPCDGGTVQAFRVYKITKPVNGKFTVYARHISYDLSRIPTMPFSVSASPSAASSTLTGLKNNATEPCPFTFWTDVTTAGNYNQKLPASIRSRLGGVEGSVLDQFGGEYEFDNYTVKLHRQRGRINTGISLRYGKNITDIKQEENITSTVTGICPYWSDTDETEVVTLPEKVVYSQYASSYPFHLTEVHDFSQLFENKPTESSLRSAAQTYVGQEKFGTPKVSIEVSFVALWQTEEYKDIAPLERVKLCDEITVDFIKLGIQKTAKVVKTVYDVLAERYRSIQVGEIRTTLAQALTDNQAETIEAIDFGNQKVYREANATAADAINNATQWLTGSNGYVVAVKDTNGTWKELLFMDTNDTQTATNVLRINTNGIGFSTTGIDGPYTNAWTIDGNLVASFMKAGILSDLAGKFSLNMATGSLNMKDGTFEGTIKGSTINVGTFQSVEGELNVYNTSGTLIYKLSKNGLTSYAPVAEGGQTVFEINYAKSGYTTDRLGHSVFSPSFIEYKDTRYNRQNAFLGLRGESILLVKSISEVDIEAPTVSIAGNVGMYGSYGSLRFDSHGIWLDANANNNIYLNADDFISFIARSAFYFDFSYGADIEMQVEESGLLQNYTGWTGTRNGLKFIKGICVGTA